MQTIHINRMKFYAYHGCLEEEARIGGEYLVDVTVTGDFSVAASSDDLKQTVDYCVVHECCMQEMKVRSNLIEHVCSRMLLRLKRQFPNQKIWVKITKLHPPIHGDVTSVAFEMHS